MLCLQQAFDFPPWQKTSHAKRASVMVVSFSYHQVYFLPVLLADKERFNQSLNSTCKLCSAQKFPNTAIACIKTCTHSQSLEKLLYFIVHWCGPYWSEGLQLLRCSVDIQTCSCMPHFGRHILVLLFQVSFLHCPLAASTVMPQKQWSQPSMLPFPSSPLP